MTDQALVQRLLAGEEAAFDEFFAASCPRLYRFALGRLDGNEDAAEEIVQRTLIRGIERLASWRGEAALLTWLYTLCRHEIADWAARERRGREISIADDRLANRAALHALAAGDAHDPELAAERRELIQLVHQTLDHLPERYGDALEWKYIENVTVDDIAARLGLGYKAAESLLSRARVAFRENFLLLTGGWRAPRPVGPMEDS